MNQSRPDQPNAADHGSETSGEISDSASDSGSVVSLTFDFEELAGAANCIHIRFGLNLYTLRKTRTGRLVLNK